jgi:hypothetical protein
MAPTKKTKKTADSINSRLALVMKSGKGEKTHLGRKYRFLATIADAFLQSLSDTSLPSRPSAPERPSSSSSPATLLLSESPSWNTTPCFPRPMSTTSLATTYVHTSPLSIKWSLLLLPNNQTLGFVRVYPAIKSFMTLEGILFAYFSSSTD